VETTLLQEVKKLQATIKVLNEVLLKDYPKREEVDKKFARTFYHLLLLGTAMLLVSLAVSFFATVSTIAVCFIDETHPAACRVIPGYEQSLENNATLLEEFRKLQQTTIENRQRIEELERQN
jgi:Fe-S-cluster containining protein